MRKGNPEQVAIITNEHLDYSKTYIIAEMIKIEKKRDEEEKRKLNGI